MRGEIYIRPYKPEDEPILREIHARADYGFAFPDNVADFLVVTDDASVPLMAAGEKLVAEITLLCAPGGSIHPLVKLEGIRLIHEALRERLAAKNFTEAHAFLPPQLEKTYGRHLVRHFGWLETWKCFLVRDWRNTCPKA